MPTWLCLSLCAACFVACRSAETRQTAGVEGRPTDAARDIDPRSSDEPSPVSSVVARAAAPTRERLTRTLAFAPHRSVFVAFPSRAEPDRLVAHLHGLCTSLESACASWATAATDLGILVCPEGNARCGPEGPGLPTWDESYAAMGDDLERAIVAATAADPAEVTRQGAILTGFSRGAYAAPAIAAQHPGRWPFLILMEADVPLSPSALQAAGVRAVAMLAGEWGTEVAGERRTCDALVQAGFPARLFVMKKVGHAYAADIEEVMREAMAFVVEAAR